MFDAIYKNLDGSRVPCTVFQIIRSSEFNCNLAAILYNPSKKQWLMVDLDCIEPDE